MNKITFAETDVTELLASSKALAEKLLGRKLADADPLVLFLKSLLSIIVQQRAIINDAANQNLLYYATGENLEKIGELVGIERKTATAAFCTAEIKLSAARSKETIVPAGTRFNAGDNVNFSLGEDVIFLAGETLKTAKAECLEVGEIGNGYKVGELCKIVDYAPFLSKITNVTETEGGADIESDDALRERIREAPNSFSVAGSEGAYVFHTKQVSADIIDVKVESLVPGEVTVWFLMKGGEVPGTEMLEAVYNHLTQDDVKPLTDLLHVLPPEVVNYNIEMRYWISRNDKTRATAIIAAVESAVEEFILWQKNSLGKDINSTELYFRVRAAGAKRCEIISPAFEVVPANAVAVAGDTSITYCGLEDE